MGKHTPAAEQQRLVQRWRETDTLMATFAKENGVHPVTFGSWVQRYDLERTQTQTPQFLPVAVAPHELSAGDFTVRLAGHTLHFDTPPPPAWFAALLRELPSC